MNRFLKFTRMGKPLYVRVDQIQGVSDRRVYTIRDGTFTDVEDALPVFEKYLAEIEANVEAAKAAMKKMAEGA